MKCGICPYPETTQYERREVTPLNPTSCIIYALNTRSFPTPAYEIVYSILWLKPNSSLQAFNSQHMQLLLACGTSSPYYSMMKNSFKQVNQIVQSVTNQQRIASLQRMALNFTRRLEIGKFKVSTMVKLICTQIKIAYIIVSIQYLHYHVQGEAKMLCSERTECGCTTCKLEG
jgi:hypothetical protein